MTSKKGKASMLWLIMLVGSLLLPTKASADGFDSIHMILMDNGGQPIMEQVDLRFSLWNTYKAHPEDFDENKNINISSPNYGGYAKTISIVPSLGGHYQMDPDVDLENFPKTSPLNAFAQMDFKPHGEPDSAYQVYDFVNDQPFNNVERKLMDSQASYYTLDAGPQTNWNTFTLDDNNNAPTQIKLQFGDDLNESLLWSKTNVRFELSDNLYVDGSLTLNGHLDFGLNEMVNARLENLASAPTCDSGSRGRLYYNASNNLPYYCNGTDWNQL